MPSGPPSRMTEIARVQGVIVISPDFNSTPGCGNCDHQTFTSPLIRSRLFSARGTSSGYSLSFGAPSAISANSRIYVGALYRPRGPGNFFGSQKSIQVFGALSAG